MLAGGTRRIVKARRLHHKLPYDLLSEIWRWVAALERNTLRRAGQGVEWLALRLQSLRRGYVARSEEPYWRSEFAIDNYLIHTFGPRSFADVNFMWRQDRLNERFGLPQMWWRKYFRYIPTDEMHRLGIAPTTTSDNLLSQWQVAQGMQALQL